MEYTEEILDRKTGELVAVSKGDWVTITELGEVLGLGPRRVRTLLRRMDFLHIEGGGSHQRHRLAKWVTDRGWGQRLKRTKSGRVEPFDVVGPDACSWIKERAAQALREIEGDETQAARFAKNALDRFRANRNEYRAKVGQQEMSVQEMICWLADHWPALTQIEIASIIDVTQQLVSRFLSIRSEHMKRAEQQRGRTPESSVCARTTVLDQL